MSTSEKDTCSCENSVFSFLFPSRKKNIVLFPVDDSSTPVAPKAEAMAEPTPEPVVSKRELSDEALTSLELDDSASHDQHDDKTDRSDDTVVATHDLETVDEEEELAEPNQGGVDVASNSNLE